MASSFDLARAREAILEAKREIRDAERRLETTGFAPINLRTARARHAMQEAESAVTELVALLNAHPGRGIDFPLIRKIRAAEIRLTKAREEIRKIDSNSTE